MEGISSCEHLQDYFCASAKEDEGRVQLNMQVEKELARERTRHG
ncbi:hypothetical protein DR92_1107 [Brucella anthropi]|nr:hypothetical protein DR92_1107 [Brucella anthropi]